MLNNTLMDEQARNAIRQDLDKTFLVEAGAGSGKTSSLVDRMAALIAEDKCRAENMAAVTFTRKAAAELRERFQLKLESASGNAHKVGDNIKKDRLSQALSHLDRVFIGTIHSFCSRLLRERPVEAGMFPDFTEIEGLEERLLEEAAWEEYLLTVRLEQPEHLKNIYGLDVTPQELKVAYQQLILYPDVELPSEPVAYPDLTEARKELANLSTAARIMLPATAPDNGWDKLQLLLRQALRWQRYFDMGQDRFLLRLLARLNKSAEPTLNRWESRETARDMESLFQDFRDQIIEPVLCRWREYRYHHLLSFLLPAVSHYQTVRERENKVNFQDLLMRTAQLLKDKSEVRTYFQDRFSHILVDEFQDTDPIQAEIMLYLTGSDTTETDWTKLTPNPGSLFVVGDPKQSIYRFRRADIDIYNHVKQQIEATGGEVLHLSANFRSLPAVIDWVNPVFSHVFSQDQPPYQASYFPMQPNRQDTTGGIVRLQLPVVYRHKQEEIVHHDARQIASWIRSGLDGQLILSRTKEEEGAGLSPVPVALDFMILVRYKSNMAHYARALESYQIPFSLSGGSDIASSRELQELHILLQTILDPDNPVFLTAVLRGLYFGISDDTLYRYKMSGGWFSFLSAIPQDAPQEVVTAITPVWETLRQYYRWSRELPAGAVLEMIMADLGLIPYTLSGSMGKGRAGYILQFIELIRRREENGQTGFASAVSYFSQLLESGLEEELDMEGGRSPGVRIMNLHKAKGLEAPVVILANPGKCVTREPDFHVNRTAGSPQGFIQIIKRGKHTSETLAQPVNWTIHQQEETRYQRAEESRLLYVAATRAKNILLISTYPAKETISPWQPLHAYLENTPVLEIPEIPVPTKNPGQPVTPGMLAQAKEEIKESMSRLKTPTYSCYTVTELSKTEDVPHRVHTGRGMSWGNVIHKALEVLVRKKEKVDLDTLIRTLLEQEMRPAEELTIVTKSLDKIMSSSFWQRVRNAAEKHTEVPFGIWESDRYLTGTMDLVFKEEEGWVLVDYKTDTVSDEDHRSQLRQYYRPQLEEYARRWQEITGETVREYGLFFTENGRYYPY